MNLTLYYFEPEEFARPARDWFADMDPRLLVLLDVFRHRWGRSVAISPHPAALGRELHEDELSDHNVTHHGAVLAADVMPVGLVDRAAGELAVALAVELGFTSIGFYPHWQPTAGLHLGTRRERRPGAPALWGAVNIAGRQTYCTLGTALEHCAKGDA